jgi:hypothetical protein
MGEKLLKWSENSLRAQTDGNDQSLASRSIRNPHKSPQINDSLKMGFRSQVTEITLKMG